MSDQHDLEMILESHFPIISIQTQEEKRALGLLKNVVLPTKRILCTWTITDGLNCTKSNDKPLELAGEDYNYDGVTSVDSSESSPTAALRHIKKQVTNAVIVFLDFHPYLDDATNIRLLKEIALDEALTGNTVVLLSHDITIPEEFSRHCAKFELSLPDSSEIERIIYDEAKVWAIKNANKKVKADKQSVDLLVRNLQGLTISDARRLIRNAIYNDGAITHADLPAVMKAKYSLLGQEGVLSFEYDTEEFANVGGFHTLVRWIEQRKDSFLNPNSALDAPKGVMLLGVQGCGKSLAAKAVAGAWGVPLLRLDFGALYNKFFGETEKNIRESLKTAQLMAPCVLWMDEIEKGIATGDYDSGTSRRVLASLLTWMAENKESVFIVATANDIQSLPPELIRKGRMDEIFFVDLPDVQTRAKIFSIHLKKRNQSIEAIDFDLLANKSEGFSGAEIEQAVVAAMYSVSAKSTMLTTQQVVVEIGETKPLSVVMAEKIAQLQSWAKQRTVSAH